MFDILYTYIQESECLQSAPSFVLNRKEKSQLRRDGKNKWCERLKWKYVADVNPSERGKRIERINEQNLSWSPSLLKNEHVNQIFFYTICSFAVPQQSV